MKYNTDFWIIQIQIINWMTLKKWSKHDFIQFFSKQEREIEIGSFYTMNFYQVGVLTIDKNVKA